MTRMHTVDLNSDLGEAFGDWQMGDDHAMLSIVSSANIACGFHAGDPLVMARTVAEAAARGVRVGAHVGYLDRAGFGRRFIDYDPAELTAEVTYQIGALAAAAAAHGSTISYIKPHGALYNAIVADDQQAEAVVAGILKATKLLGPLQVMGLPGAKSLEHAAAAGLETIVEAFADRAYHADGTLVSRKLEGSVIYDPVVCAERVVAMATGAPITAYDGTHITLEPDSVCVHGDTPAAVDIARQIRTALDAAGVGVAARR